MPYTFDAIHSRPSETMEMTPPTLDVASELQNSPAEEARHSTGFSAMGRTLISYMAERLTRPSSRTLARLAAGSLAFMGAVEPLASAEPYTARKASPVEHIQGAINTNNPAYASALASYQSDPYRTEEWAGDQYPSATDIFPMFVECSPGVRDMYGDPSFKYEKSTQVLNVSFISGPPRYCDLMGTTTEDITVQEKVRQHGHEVYKQIGEKIVYEDGLREALAWYMPPVDAKSYFQKTLPVPDIGNLCPRGEHSTADIRVDIFRDFSGNPNETFQHRSLAGFGTTPEKLYDGSTSFTTQFKNVCK